MQYEVKRKLKTEHVTRMEKCHFRTKSVLLKIYIIKFKHQNIEEEYLSYLLMFISENIT